MNTLNQAAWFERYLTDWTSPHGRPGRTSFRMKDFSVPGRHVASTVTAVDADGTGCGCGWADVELSLSVDDDVKTNCTARIAVLTSPDDNPWTRRGECWNA